MTKYSLYSIWKAGMTMIVQKHICVQSSLKQNTFVFKLILRIAQHCFSKDLSEISFFIYNNSDSSTSRTIVPTNVCVYAPVVNTADNIA